MSTKNIVATIEVDPMKMKAVEAVFALITEHFDNLPQAMQDALLEASEIGFPVYDADYLHSIGLASADVYVDGVFTCDVISICPITKTVRIMNVGDVKVKSAWAVSDGKFICGFGEKHKIANE